MATGKSITGVSVIYGGICKYMELANNKNNLCSIIIPNYNGGKAVVESIRSVLATDYTRKEIVVVDDCSRDNSPEEIVKEFTDIKLIRNNRNLGFAKSVNKGILNSSGDIIALLNMDTIVERNWLKGLVDVLENDEKCGLVGSKIYYPGSKRIQHAGGRLLENGLAFHMGKNEEDKGQYDKVMEVDYLCGASIAFRRTLIEKLGGGLSEAYSPMYYEDTDLALKIKNSGYKVIYSPDSVLTHIENISNGALSYDFYYAFHKNRIRFIIRNYGLRYLFTKFLRAEKKWLKEQKQPPEVLKPLQRAYLFHLLTFFL